MVREWASKSGVDHRQRFHARCVRVAGVGARCHDEQRSDFPTCGAAIPTPRAWRMVFIIARIKAASSRRPDTPMGVRAARTGRHWRPVRAPDPADGFGVLSENRMPELGNFQGHCETSQSGTCRPTLVANTACCLSKV